MARYELIEGSSKKFWEITLDGKSFTARWGRIGSDGQSKTQKFKNPADAKKEHDKLVAEKLKKGYQLAGKKATTTATTKSAAKEKPSAGNVGDAWTRIEKWIAANAASMELPKGASKKELAGCAKKLGVKFPDDLAQSLSRHGGESDWGGADLVGNWKLLDVSGIAYEHGLMKRLIDDGTISGKADAHSRITAEWWSPAWIPIVSSGSGHQICVDMSSSGTKGQVILFLHDDTKRFVLADSFAAWWSAIAEGLEKNRFGWDGERFADEAFLSIALEGRDLYRPKPKGRR